MLNSINIMAALTKYSGPGGYNDADLLIGSGKSAALFLLPAHSRSQFSLWCVMATPLLVGASANMTAFDLETYSNRELIEVSQDTGGAVGQRVQGGNLTIILGGTNVWARTLRDGSVAASFFNAHNFKTLDIPCPLQALGFQENDVVRVRDLWEHAELGNATGIFTAKRVAPGASSSFRFWKL